MKKCDVAIVGAGLAGLQCAQLLAKSGIKVTLVDRKSSLKDHIHTTGIFVRRTFEDFDLPTDCLGPSISDVTLYSPKRRAMHLTSPFAEFRVGRMGLIYERYLERCERAGVKWLKSTRYLGHEVNANTVTVHLESKEKTTALKTRFIIGADGANSKVARNLGLDTNEEWIVGVEDVFQGIPLLGPPRMHCFLDPKLAPGYLAWVVNDGEEVHIGVGGYAARFDPLHALEKFESTVDRIVDMRNARHVERRGGRIPVGGVLKNICSIHGLLIGDASGAVSPLTAGGLDPCMRLSHLAASVASEYLLSGDVAVLQTYSGNRFRSRFASRLFMRRLLTGVQNSEILELGCGLMRLPVLNHLAWHVFFGRGSFPNVDHPRLPLINFAAEIH